MASITTAIIRKSAGSRRLARRSQKRLRSILPLWRSSASSSDVIR